MLTSLTLDGRLALAANFVREDSVVCDIGTDHAYLPIYLLLTKRSTDAIAADINEGPLERARLNCKKYALEDKVTFCLADGLQGLPLQEKKVSDIVICGMGGELIASIIDASEYVKNAEVQLILQPMSQASKLRRYLCENGFNITNGGMTAAQGRLYQCIVCRYDGIKRELSPAELELGPENIKNRPAPFFENSLSALIEKTKRAIDGRMEGGLDCTEQNTLLSELISIQNHTAERDS